MVTSESDSAFEGTGGLRLSRYPISPRFAGKGSACGRVVDPSLETMEEEEEETVVMTGERGRIIHRTACAWQVDKKQKEEPGLVGRGGGTVVDDVGRKRALLTLAPSGNPHQNPFTTDKLRGKCRGSW